VRVAATFKGRLRFVDLAGCRDSRYKFRSIWLT